MQHRHIFKALNRTLQDIRNNTRLFGGITLLFGGNFRQTTSVLPTASRQRIVNSSLKCSSLWNHIHVLHLKQNMCLDRTPESDTFAAWLLTVGAGRAPNINLPPNMCLPDNTVNGLINAIYPGFAQGNKPDKYFLEL
jgi:hypothetical protein